MSEFSFAQRDALLRKETAFPAGGAAIKTGVFDLGEITRLGYRNSNMRFVLTSPELTATQLPEDALLMFVLEFCDDETFPTDEVVTVTISDWQQTGSEEGAVELVKEYRPETDAKRYVRLGCTNTGGVLTDASFMFEIVTSS